MDDPFFSVLKLEKVKEKNATQFRLELGKTALLEVE